LKTMRAIQVLETGDTDQLRLIEAPVPQPGPDQVRIKVTAAGLNFIDVYHRTGLYPLPLPFTLGLEGAGTIDAVGANVRDWQVGDRVATAAGSGTYAEYALVQPTKLVHVPDAVDLDQAAAVMLQGMTAHYLTHSTYPLKAGETLLLHAAAGGVGLLLVQIAKKIGARVIGTASTEAKAALAHAAGADEVIRYTEEDFVARVKQLTDGRGVDVVYDSVGKSTYEGSMASLRPRGYMVFFGNASGPVPPLDPLILSRNGSLFLTRPTLASYTATPEELAWRAGDLFSWIAAGELQVRIDRRYDLADAGAAHRALEGRETAGKVLIVPT
jgi:NADPH2:quinone reductase